MRRKFVFNHPSLSFHCSVGLSWHHLACQPENLGGGPAWTIVEWDEGNFLTFNLTLRRPTLTIDYSVQLIRCYSLSLLVDSLTDKPCNFRNCPGSYEKKWCPEEGHRTISGYGELPPVNALT